MGLPSCFVIYIPFIDHYFLSAWICLFLYFYVSASDTPYRDRLKCACIKEEFGNDLVDSPVIESFYHNTLDYVKLKKDDAREDVRERFEAIVL